MDLKKRSLALCFITALLLPAVAFTSCSSDDGIAATTPKEGLKLTIHGSLESANGETRGSGAQWIDENGAKGGGLKFSWSKTSNNAMYCSVFSAKKGGFLTTEDGYAFSKVFLNIDKNNPALADLSSETPFDTSDYEWDEKDVVICCTTPEGGVASSISDTNTGVQFNLPCSNTFTQTEANSTKGIRDYMCLLGQSSLPKAANGDVTDVKMTFQHITSTIRYVIRNKRNEKANVTKVSMSFEDKVIPTAEDYKPSLNYLYNTSSKDGLSSSIDYGNSEKTVTTNFGSNNIGLTVDTTDPLIGYAVVLPIDGKNITGNATFTLQTTSDNGNVEYVTDEIPVSTLLAQKTGENKFKSGYVYTVYLLLDDKLSVGDVTVTPWEEVVGDSFDDTLLGQLTFQDYCKDDTYKTQREALTSLTLDGSKLTSDEVTNYMKGNFAKYFPNVKTLIIKGTSLAQPGLLENNETVTTVIGMELTSLPDYAFRRYKNDLTLPDATYIFPNVESVGSPCFQSNFAAEISLPKLKAFRGKMFNESPKLKHACFASLTDFTKASSEFTSVEDLAFGSADEFKFLSGRNLASILPGDRDQQDAAARNITLYLNEKGYEYQNNVNLDRKTWRQAQFKDIKKYSEYPYKKD